MSQEGPPSNVFLVSSYTDPSLLAHTPKGNLGNGVNVLQLDSETGKLQLLTTLSLGPNPAFLVKHPHRNIIYASTERIDADGEVVAMTMDKAGQLSVLGRVTAAGKSTCYLNIHKSHKYMLAVNYWDAKVNLLELDDTGRLSAPREIHMQPAAAYVEANQPTREEHWQFRQRWPHSHCVVTEPYTSRLHFVVDLGQDKVFVYRIDMDGGTLVPRAEVALPPGRGPRHLLFHPEHRVAYVVNELESSVTVLRYQEREELHGGSARGDAVHAEHSVDTPHAVLFEAQVIPTLPEDFDNAHVFVDTQGVWKAKSHCSELRLRPDGKFLYVGNRGHDSICVFRVCERTGELSREHIVPSGGRCPRNFNFDRTGNFLVVGNQDSNNLSVFRLCKDTGAMTLSSTVVVPSPNYVYALPTAEEQAARPPSPGATEHVGFPSATTMAVDVDIDTQKRESAPSAVAITAQAA